MNEEKRAISDRFGRGAVLVPWCGRPTGRRLDPVTGMHTSYWVLSVAERSKGFVRPVRRSYRHLTCGSVTTMGPALAETCARDPKFYGATMCVSCKGHYPVGDGGEFVWDGTTVKVGT